MALEYLLFGGIEVSNQEVYNRIQDKEFAWVYIKECAAQIKIRVDNIVNAWESGYKNTFINNAGTDVGSSTSELYNEFVKSFESIKNFKLELPLGKRPGQTQAEPQLVEAYYSGMTLHFLKLHIQAIENIYFGKGFNGESGIGFKNYVESVTGGPTLVESTINQWDVVKNTLSLIPENEPLSEQVRLNPQPMEQLATELQRHTRFFKSDMSSVLGIAITFSSGDGD